MRQRVAIAIALLHGPALIIADEPTTALDVSVQAQIIHEMRGLVRNSGTSLIWITHDLATVSSLADDILVMYAGQVVEAGPTRTILGAAPPLHARPARQRPEPEPARGRASQIAGSTPSLCLPKGCPFAPRVMRPRRPARSPRGWSSLRAGRSAATIRKGSP